MRVRMTLFCLWMTMVLCTMVGRGQSADSISGKLVGFPGKLLGRIQSKTARLDQQLTRQTQKYLEKMAKQENKLRKKMYRMDSTSAKRFFGDGSAQYAALSQKIGTDTGKADIRLQGAYMTYMDSIKTTLSFLQQNPSLLNAGLTSKVKAATGEFRQLQARMQDAADIRQFVEQRKEQIRQYLQQFTHLPPGIAGAFTDYKKQAYYYSQRVQAYKEELNDPDKLLLRGLQILNKVPAFSSFVKQHSMLASLFNIPSNGGPAPGGASLGMATRDQVLAAVRGSSYVPGATADPAAGLQQSVNNAQGQVDQLPSKLASTGGGDLDMPNFKPNQQKAKSFFRRLQLGVNLQSAHSNYYFPTTSDIGVSLGYKLNDKNVVGIGVSYKMGWGSGFNHIQLSGQGVGLRSFTDIHIDKTFFASGGFEYNYQRPFDLQRFPDKLQSWQKSGLIGVSKIVSMKSGVLKNAKLQLLWDFLSYQQRPKTQPVKFRIGYSF